MPRAFLGASPSTTVDYCYRLIYVKMLLMIARFYRRRRSYARRATNALLLNDFCLVIVSEMTAGRFTPDFPYWLLLPPPAHGACSMRATRHDGTTTSLDYSDASRVEPGRLCCSGAQWRVISCRGIRPTDCRLRTPGHMLINSNDGTYGEAELYRSWRGAA